MILKWSAEPAGLRYWGYLSSRRLPSLPPNGSNVKSSCLKGRPSGGWLDVERQGRHHEGRVGWLQSRPLPISEFP